MPRRHCRPVAQRVAELDDAGLDQIVLLPPLDAKEAVVADVARELIGSGRLVQDSTRAVSKDAGIARLILVNGPPASGKSTLARRYVDDHDRAALVEVDTLRMTLPNWGRTRRQARR